MKCPNCQAEISDSAKFCPECGAKTNQKKVCSNCGIELPQNVKFCPECGTPCTQQDQAAAYNQQPVEEQRKDVFLILQQDLDEAIGNDYKLVSIDAIDSSNGNLVEVGIDDDGDAVIVGKSRGRVSVSIDFTYRELKKRQQYSATMLCNFIVKQYNEVEMENYEFTNVNDEEGEDGGDTWSKVGNFAKGAASVLGAVGLGFLQGLANAANDDDDDY